MLDLRKSPSPKAAPEPKPAQPQRAVMRYGQGGGRQTNPVAGPRTDRPRLPGPRREASTPRPRLGAYQPPRRLAPEVGPLRMSRPTLGQMGEFRGELPGMSSAGLPIATTNNPTADVPVVSIGDNMVGFIPSPNGGGLGNRPGRGTGLGNEPGIPVLGNAATLSPVNSAPNATVAPAFVPGDPNGVISPHVDLNLPTNHNLPNGSPDGTPDGRGNAPMGPEVGISTGGGGGIGGEAALPSYGAKALGGPTPGFPSLASKEGLHGTVIVTVTLNSRGRVVKAEPSEKSDADVLDNAAVRASRTWSYRPAMERGVAIGGTVRLKFVFEDEKVQVTPL